MTASDGDAAPVLALSGVGKSFGPVPVLRGIDLELRRGEIHAVLGENGAGKSTLMKILVGIERADRGALRLGDETYVPRDPAEARRRGVVLVPQERTLCPHLDVLENIVLGIEPAGPLGVLREDQARAIAERALGLVVGASTKAIDGGGGAAGRISLDARAGSLSVADQQLVEIARALAQAGVGADANRSAVARVLILDEPTASLGKGDADRLFERLHALKAAGLALVLVTHYLGDVQAHADRYTVLRDGKVGGAGDPRVVPADRIVHEMLGRELETMRDEASASHAREGVAVVAPDGDIVLSVRSVAGPAKPENASFEVRRGEIFGIAGLVGSGRTELLRAIIGLDRLRRGEISVNAPRGIGLLSEDRGGEGLMLARSIADNIELSSRGPFVVSPAQVREEAQRWMAELAVRARDPEQRVVELSGGNQQKVQFGRLLREDYDLLLVDEPTRGIDVASKAQVLDLLRRLAAAGKAVVLVSSQLDELVTTCDRIAVLRRGHLGDARPRADWTEEALLLEAAS